MAKKIVTNNLKKILGEKKKTAIWVRSELKRIGYPIQKERFSDLMQNKREIYFGEAIFIAEVLKLRVYDGQLKPDYDQLVNGNVNELKTVKS